MTQLSFVNLSIVSYVLSTAVLGCSAPATPPAPPAPAQPQCTADLSLSKLRDVRALAGGPTRTPVLATTVDANGVMAVWLATTSTLRLGQFAFDGSASADALAVPGIRLPGGDAGLGAVSIAPIGGKTLIAYIDATTNAVHSRVVDAAAAGAEPIRLSPATRSYERSPAEPVNPGYVEVRPHEDMVFATWAETASSGARFSIAQVLDSNGVPVTKQASFWWGRAVDGYISSGRFRLVHYRQGAGSIADQRLVLAESDASGDLATWTSVDVALPQPGTGTVSRAHPNLLHVGDGSVYVGSATYTNEMRDPATRIEVAWLDNAGTITTTGSFDLAGGRDLAGRMAARAAGDAVYVTWADEKSGNVDPTLHLRKITADGGGVTIDVPLALERGYLDDVGSVSGIVVDREVVHVSYAWTSQNDSGDRTRHPALHTFCLAARAGSAP